MKTLRNYLFICFSLLITSVFSQRGKNGGLAVNTANRIVNEYTALTVNAAVGASTITVASSNLNANNRFAGPLAAGDLIMIIQMQGASIPGSTVEFPVGSGVFYGIPNNNTWGQISNYNNCGNYEFVQVSSVPNATSIIIDCGLVHAYTAAGKVQVIRVPRYSSLTVTLPGSIIPQTWNGTVGGVIAIENLGNTIVNATNGMNASAMGFRGGATSPNNASYGGGQHAMPNAAEGAEKGEGIVGYQADYNPYGGRYCRGQAGNAGGGGNNHNSAGGGGSNAGSLTGYDGLGNPDVSGGPGWVTAWNLEGGAFSAHTSPGGGRGGYSFAASGGSNRDATVLAPGNATWAGDSRRNVGGLGGHNLDYSTGKIFMGGGGGAGDKDNNAGGVGGVGGGLIYLMNYGTVSGTGSISSNGGNGGNSGIDGAGGAGGGGTVIINSVGAISGITISANGGRGGNQVVTNPVFSFSETEGPGGGGGGGYIAISNGLPPQVSAGGANGTSNSNMITEFTPNGATMGGEGLINQLITWDTIKSRDTTICSGNSVVLSATLHGTIPTGTSIVWYSAQAGGTVLASGPTFITPILNTTTTYYVGFCPGTYTIPVVVTVTSPPNVTITQQSPLCVSSSSVALGVATTGGTWAGTGITNTTTGTFDPTIAGVGSHLVTYTLTTPCLATDTMTILVVAGPNATITQVGPFCENSSVVTLSAATGGGTWSGTGITSSTNGTFLPSAAGAGTHVITYTIINPCFSVDTVLIVVIPNSSATIVQAGPFCVTSSPVNLSAAWPIGDWSGTGITDTLIGMFDPAIAGIGSHIITYVVSGVCPGIDTATLTVIPVPNPAIIQVGPYCLGAPPINLVATIPGGNWTGTGITNSTNGTFNPAIAGIGSHTIFYTVYNPCVAIDSVTIVVNTIADATITQVGPLCSQAASVNLAAATAGGTWSGNGITNAASGTFSPSAAGVGSHIITYTLSGACSGVDTMTIVVNTTSNATITQAGPYCVSAGSTTLSAATAGGNWTGTGITNAVSGDFNPAIAGVGSHLITYTIGGVCPGLDTMIIVVTLNSNATITQAGPLCVSASPVALTAATSGGVWSGAGITNTATGIFNPNIAGIGSHLITYTISGTCSAVDTMLIVVNTTSNATITQTLPVCTSSAVVTLAAANSGGVWTGTGIINGATGLFDPSLAGPGSHIITYTISGPCSAIDTMTVLVVPATNATISPVNAVCLNSPAFNLTANTSGGIWSGSGIVSATAGTFDPAVSGVGSFTVSYAISGICGDTATQLIRVNPLPTPNVTSAVLQGCAPLCSTFNESTGANCFSVLYDFGDGNTSSTSPATHCYSLSGVYNVSITCTDANNCTATTVNNNMITVFSVPAAVASGDVTIYQGESTPLMGSGGTGYNWFPSTDLSCNNCANPLATPLQTITYCVEVINSNSCADTTCVTVTVEDKPCGNYDNLQIPNAFSPNNDGANDEFCLQGWDNCIDAFTILIFDRWGEKVYSSKDAAFCWDGKYNGKILDAQVLVYYINAKQKNNTPIKKKGNISLIR